MEPFEIEQSQETHECMKWYELLGNFNLLLALEVKPQTR